MEHMKPKPKNAPKDDFVEDVLRQLADAHVELTVVRKGNEVLLVGTQGDEHQLSELNGVENLTEEVL